MKWGMLFAFLVIGLFSSTFLVLRAVYFHVLGNQVYWTDLYDQRSSSWIIPRAATLITLNSWSLVVGFFNSWWLALSRGHSRNIPTKVCWHRVSAWFGQAPIWHQYAARSCGKRHSARTECGERHSARTECGERHSARTECGERHGDKMESHISWDIGTQPRQNFGNWLVSWYLFTRNGTLLVSFPCVCT